MPSDVYGMRARKFTPLYPVGALGVYLVSLSLCRALRKSKTRITIPDTLLLEVGKKKKTIQLQAGRQPVSKAFASKASV